MAGCIFISLKINL